MEMRRTGSTRLEDKSLGNQQMKYSLYFALSSLAGFLLSLYAAYVESKIEEDDNYKAMCDINEKISCTKVFSSIYGKGFGILGKVFGENSLLNQPNGYLGIAFYGFFIVTSFLHNSALMKIQLLLSTLSVILSIYLAYLLYFVLEDFCVVCISTYVVNLINLTTIWKKLKISKRGKTGNSQNKYTKKFN